MRTFWIPLGLSAILSACGYVDAYEEAVHDLEPTYCYQSIGTVACFREPYHRDERRLVNYFGPHPSRFDKPEPPTPTPLSPPEMVNYWVKDAEPIPRPAPTGKVSNLPWLDPARNAEQLARIEFARKAESRDGVDALLARMGIGRHGEVAPVAGAEAPPRPGVPAPAAKTNDGKAAARGVPEQPAPPAVPVPPVIEVDVN
ncbi:MAG: hypothetical protein ACE5GT_02060 [Rhodospirillales bacterium]